MQRLGLVAAAALAVASTVPAWAEEPPKPMADWISGTVAHYTLTPKGDVDGFVLVDGTQVHVVPHLGAALVYTARPGDAVAMQGSPQQPGPLIEADEIRNSSSGVQFVNAGPEKRPEAPQAETVAGKIDFVLQGPQGDTNGAILADGTVLRLSPHLAAQNLAAGQAVTAEGEARTTPMVKVVEVVKLNASPGGS